jgi:flagellar basal body-associated protein FliL
MGLLTWIIVGVVLLAIIGLGWQVFFSGVTRGAEKVTSNPTVKSASNEAKEFVANLTNNVTNGIGRELTSK